VTSQPCGIHIIARNSQYNRLTYRIQALYCSYINYTSRKGTFQLKQENIIQTFSMTNWRNRYMNIKMPSQHSYLWTHACTSSTEPVKLAAMTQ